MSQGLKPKFGAVPDVRDKSRTYLIRNKIFGIPVSGRKQIKS
jgi:hypothetical protein